MGRNQENELQPEAPGSAEREDEASEATDSAATRPRSEQDDSKPAERPDLTWSEHED